MTPKHTTSTAPGKIILFGEHAVVYGRPAIAVPVAQVHAQATVAASQSSSVAIEAADLARRYTLRDAAPDDPIGAIVRLTCEKIGVEPRGFSVRIRSTIPVARGLGSGAAVSVATARAIAKSFGCELSREQVSALAFEVEKLHHGTPSGIDNSVIAFEQPVYFVKVQPIAPPRLTEDESSNIHQGDGAAAQLEAFRVARPFLIAIADTGIASPTKIAVGDVRRSWEADRAQYEARFDQIGEIARQARIAIERGEVTSLGSLMLKNQELLKQIGVSSEQIERLVDAAVGAGAEGAKLSGAGRGGNVIALVDEDSHEYVERAMKRAGAVRVIVTKVG